MLTKPTDIARGFPKFRESDWRALVDASLGGTPFDSLSTATDDGFAIGPIDVAAQGSGVVTRPAGRPWAVVQTIDDPDPERARRQISSDLAGGAGGIALVFPGSAAATRSGFGLEGMLADLLERIERPDRLHLRLEAGEASRSYGDILRDRRFASLTLAHDPLAEAAARGGFNRPPSDIEREFVEATHALEERGEDGAAAIADGRVWAAGGASEAQELAGILGALAWSARVLTQAGIAPETALKRVGITVETGQNRLVSVAKMRAARLLHARFVEAFGLPPMRATIHAETSWRMMTRHDPHTNILRTTSAAFAAGVGGADSISVLPFTMAVGLSDAFARRVARNSQIVLLDEAGLAHVGDPGAGSGTIEALTAALAARAWQIFRAIEAAGGLLAALRAGSFQKDIEAMRRARANRIARREMAITGVSEFPTLDEAKVAVLAPRPLAPLRKAAQAEAFAAIEATRLAEPFEALRERAAALAAAGRPPRIFLAGIGAADFAEAAQAARNFFAAGGIATIEGGGFETAEKAAEAFAASGARAVCLVGDAGVPEKGGRAAGAALKARGAARVHALPGAATGEGIDTVLRDDADMIAVLGDVLSCWETG